MKNWQFFLAIFILIILLCIVSMKVKESLETSLQNDIMIYDINNTINYRESNFNVMNRELIEKNKTTIQEEDELIEKNKQIAIDLPTCNNNKENRTNYLNEVTIPNLNSVEKKIQDTQNEVGNFVKKYNSRNDQQTLAYYNNPDEGIPYYTNEINNCNIGYNNLEKEYHRRRNLPTGYYSIKSARTGRYCTDTGEGISCDAAQLLPWEKFYIENHGGGLFVIRGGRNGQLCADDGVLICNRNNLGPWEYTRIYYQGNNLYALRGGQHGRLCSNTGRITCDRDHYLLWEQFIIEPWPSLADLPDGTYVFTGGRANQNCADEGNQFICNRGYVQQWEKMRLKNLGNGKYSIRGGRNGKYCADEGNNVVCNRDGVAQWEIFTIINIGEGYYNIIGGKDNKYCADDNTLMCNRAAASDWERIKITPDWQF